MTLVFDSGKTHLAPIPHAHKNQNLEIVYTPFNMSADDYILEMLIALTNPKLVTVITDDRELSMRCKEIGSFTQKLKPFTARLKNKIAREDVKTHTLSQSESERLRKIFEDKLNE